MILGTSDLWERIQKGSPARFNSDGSQIKPTDDEIKKGEAGWSEKLNLWIWTLIDNIPDDFKIEGCTVDFRLDRIFYHQGGAELYLDKRNTGKTYEVFPVYNKFIFKPHTPILVQTMELVNMPMDLMMIPGPRTTMFRSGIALYLTFTNPNYFGPLTFLAENITERSISIEKGFRIAQMAFAQVSGVNEAYVGQWQSGSKAGTQGDFVAPR